MPSQPVFTAMMSTHFMDLSSFEKPPIEVLLKKFPTFYGTRRFITVFTRVLHWALF
jgi:hypothetical protein